MKRVFFIFFLCLSVTFLWAADDFRNVSLGTSQNVCGIVSDTQGILWVGTEDGLYSYDGYRARRRFERNQPENTRVHALCLYNHIIYLGTDAGLLAYDTQQDCYLPMPKAPHVIRVLKAQDNGLLLGANDGLYVYDRRTGRIQRYGGISQTVYSLEKTPQGLLVGTLRGLYCIQKGKSRLIPLGGQRQPLVNAMVYDRQRREMWVGTIGTLYHGTMNNFQEVTQLKGNSVKSLQVMADGTVYAGTDNGLYACLPSGDVHSYRHDTRSDESLANNIVWALTTDQWQNLWVGTDNGLSCKLQHDFYDFRTLNELTGTGEGSCLHALLLEPDQTLWMGGTNGLIRQEAAGLPTQGTARWYKQFSEPYSLSHNRVRKIFRDSDGDILVCTDDGLNFYERQSGHFRNFIVRDTTGHYSTEWAYDIVEDDQGRYWIAAYMGGVAVIDKHRLLASDGQPVADHYFTTQLSSVHVGQLALDRRGRLWVGLYNKGLDRIDTHSMQVTHILQDVGTVQVEADVLGNVAAVYRDSFLYVNTESDDMLRHATGTGEERILAMGFADQQLWLLTNGRCRIFNAQGSSVSISLSDLQPYAFWYDKQHDEVWLGGNDRYLVMPAAMAAYQGPRPLMLTDLLVNGHSYHGTEGDVRYLNSISLCHNENNIELRLTDLPMQGRPLFTYAYRLKGIDQGWKAMSTTNPVIRYDGLPPGSYHLKVCTLDAEQQAMTTVYKIDIEIRQPWYLTWWARLFYVLLLALILIGGFRYYMVKRKLLQEQRERIQSLEQSHIRMEFFRRLSQDLQNPLAVIMGQLYQLLKNDQNQELEQIRRSSEDLGQRIEQALDLRLERQMMSTTAQSQESTADERLLKEIIQLTDEHMADSDFNVSRLQELLGIGSKQLYRKVKQLTGKTPVEFIRDMRMKKAALLLAEGKFSVSEVMYMVGFSNSGYFSKCFQQAHGMLPTAYSAKHM